jgi:hypothetical protein
MKIELRNTLCEEVPQENASLEVLVTEVGGVLRQADISPTRAACELFTVAEVQSPPRNNTCTAIRNTPYFLNSRCNLLNSLESCAVNRMTQRISAIGEAPGTVRSITIGSFGCKAISSKLRVTRKRLESACRASRWSCMSSSGMLRDSMLTT